MSTSSTWLDGALYPDVEPPETLATLGERVDFLACLCATWDFGLLPEAETVRGRCFLPAVIFLGIVGGNPAAGQEKAVVERLVHLEEGQKALMQRLEDVHKNLGQRIEVTNQRVDDLRTDMNQRFENMNQRFADLNFWLQLIFGTIFATLGAVLVQWATTIRRTTQVTERLEAHLAETEKDRLLTFQREEIELLKGRLERVEQALQKG